MYNTDKSTLNDCYRIGGSYFPVPDSAKGDESGPENLTGGQSDRQKGPRLNASKPGESNSSWGAEGKSFPPADNSKDSQDEQATFAGKKDSTVSVNLATGQINSAEARLVPIPLPGEPETIRANVRFKKAKGDVKENRV
jgi:hypothetical protein